MWGKIYKAVFILGFASLIFYVVFCREEFQKGKPGDNLDGSIEFDSKKETEEPETEVADTALSAVQESADEETETTAGILETEILPDSYEGTKFRYRKDYAMDASQCLWGTWKVTQRYFGEGGLQECEDGDEMKDMEITFLPDKILIEDMDIDEGIYEYEARLIAVYEGDEYISARYSKKVGDLKGVKGSYVLEIMWRCKEGVVIQIPLVRIEIIADDEIIIHRYKREYKAVKIEDVEIEEDKDMDFCMDRPDAGIANGEWLITEANEKVFPGAKLGTQVSIGTGNTDVVSCRAISLDGEGVKESAERLKITGGGSFIVYCKLGGGFWDEMIVKDSRSAVFVKDGAFFQATRIGDVSEDMYR